MKEYIKPTLDYVEIKPEERFAATSCYEAGACPNGIRYWETPSGD